MVYKGKMNESIGHIIMWYMVTLTPPTTMLSMSHSCDVENATTFSFFVSAYNVSFFFYFFFCQHTCSQCSKRNWYECRKKMEEGEGERR